MTGLNMLVSVDGLLALKVLALAGRGPLKPPFHLTAPLMADG